MAWAVCSAVDANAPNAVKLLLTEAGALSLFRLTLSPELVIFGDFKQWISLLVEAGPRGVTMLTIDDFDKTDGTPQRLSRRVIRMTPKVPISGLDNLEISVFDTGWKRGDKVIWGWKWDSDQVWGYSSVDKHYGRPEEDYFNIESAALAAIKSASYWSDDERIPRQEKERAESARKKEMQDRQINRFLNS